MQLKSENIKLIKNHEAILLPNAEMFQLQEKVLQFGTGVLLRGLPDYYINKANEQEIFNGRIVVVKSTGNGSTDAFSIQDNLFTHCIKGIENGEITERYTINCAISRVLNANDQWQEVLNCALNLQLHFIISNPAKVGIALLATDKINSCPIFALA